jgi:HAD superfamily hydrolase (TIGR01509 family)
MATTGCDNFKSAPIGQSGRISLVIFDCDGVLVDSEVIACREDAACLSEAGFPVTPEEMARRFVGTSAKSMLVTLSEQYQRQPRPGLNELRQARIVAAFEGELQPIPGIREALSQLHAKRCIASSSPLHRIVRSLELTGLRDYFADSLYSASMVSRGKPAPDLFLYAAAQMKIDPSECVVIEDSPSGVVGAVTAGMRVIGFVGGSHCGPGHAERLRAAGADVVISLMADLPKVLPDCYTAV